jgi:hypothetical protein
MTNRVDKIFAKTDGVRSLYYLLKSLFGMTEGVQDIFTTKNWVDYVCSLEQKRPRRGKQRTPS